MIYEQPGTQWVSKLNRCFLFIGVLFLRSMVCLVKRVKVHNMYVQEICVWWGNMLESSFSQSKGVNEQEAHALSSKRGAVNRNEDDGVVIRGRERKNKEKREGKLTWDRTLRIRRRTRRQVVGRIRITSLQAMQTNLVASFLYEWPELTCAYAHTHTHTAPMAKGGTVE